MKPTSELFCFFLLLLSVSGYALGQEHISTPANDDPKGDCSCGGFPTTEPAENSEPLLAQTPGLVVKCNDEGASSCKSLCLALATATKAKGPEILCNRLKDANELKLSAFYKICNGTWSYAEMTAEETLCCESSKVIECASLEGIANTRKMNTKDILLV